MADAKDNLQIFRILLFLFVACASSLELRSNHLEIKNDDQNETSLNLSQRNDSNASAAGGLFRGDTNTKDSNIKTARRLGEDKLDGEYSGCHNSHEIEPKHSCSCRFNICNCSNQRLNAVPSDLPFDMTTLILNNNFIQVLQNGVFSNYSRLRNLSLEGNKLKFLCEDSFQGLSQLEVLNLFANSLKYNEANFPTGVFKPLSSLKTLILNKNNKDLKNCSYPHISLSVLTNVQTLYLDGISTNFGVGFTNMTHLQTLVLVGYLSGYCNLISLNNSTFVNLKQITALNLSDCGLSGSKVSHNTFENLTNLQSLDLSSNWNFEMENLIKMKWNPNLTKLYINAVVSRFSKSLTITEEYVANLPKFLTHLQARDNCFESVSENVLSKLPTSLKHLDIGGNRFLYGTYVRNLSHLESLETLILDGAGQVHKLPRSRNRELEEVMERKENSLGIDFFSIAVPPVLKTLKMDGAGLQYLLSKIKITNKNRIENLILSSNYFPVIMGPIFGLENIKYIALKFTSTHTIDKQFFNNLVSLENVSLANNVIGESLEKSKTGNSLFHPLRNLTTLDLSHNFITTMPNNTFKNLDKLQILNLESNNMWQFTVDISHMNNLTLLNLSRCQLTSLPVKLRNHIDFLTTKPGHSITVDLSLNPINCDCDNFEFIQWMKKSPAFDANFTHYMCQYSDGSFRYVTDGYDKTLLELNRACVSNYIIFLIAVLSTIVLAAAVVACIIYRFRWKLRYLYFVAYNKFKTPKEAESSFNHDAFVSYACADENFIVNELMPELQSHGVDLFIHGRDFVTGDYIASNIVTAVRESRKTLVVLTRHLLKSTWCNYELQMANMESVHTGRRVLLFLLKDSIPAGELGHELLYHIRSNTYITYPSSNNSSDRELRVFWQKLANDIRQP
ncbi:toll-like receptor 4 [Physella acuta]|uniref:toll-like receptor 4 n=1 Tax=Physella acuta TaxID=109671 RepID=UPI0027DE113C|nr:toll-like receptor 4 [Physella acuta]